MALRGSLNETDPEDVLQVLAMGGKTGVLRVLEGGHTTELVLEKGRIIDAFDGIHRGEDAIFGLLSRRSGSFTFNAQEVPPERTIERDVESILLSAARRLDGLAYAKKLLGQPTARPYILENAESDDAELTEADRTVLKLVDGKHTLGEIAAGSGLEWEDAYAALGHLVEQGAIALATAQNESSPLLAGNGEPLLEESGGAPAELAAADKPPTPEELEEIIAYLRST